MCAKTRVRALIGVVARVRERRRLLHRNGGGGGGDGGNSGRRPLLLLQTNAAVLPIALTARRHVESLSARAPCFLRADRSAKRQRTSRKTIRLCYKQIILLCL